MTPPPQKLHHPIKRTIGEMDSNGSPPRERNWIQILTVISSIKFWPYLIRSDLLHVFIPGSRRKWVSFPHLPFVYKNWLFITITSWEIQVLVDTKLLSEIEEWNRSLEPQQTPINSSFINQKTNCRIICGTKLLHANTCTAPSNDQNLILEQSSGVLMIVCEKLPSFSTDPCYYSIFTSLIFKKLVWGVKLPDSYRIDLNWASKCQN